LLICKAIKFADERSFGRIALPSDAAPEYDPADPETARGILFHDALGHVLVTIDGRSPFCSRKEERRHVAGREAGEERLLRIDPCQVVKACAAWRDRDVLTSTPPSNHLECR